MKAAATAGKPLPQHPLVISDPLGARQAGTPADLPLKTYLPLIFRGG